MTQLDIIDLLNLSPDSKFPQIKRAYRKRRKEIAKDSRSELERLDRAYEQAKSWFKINREPPISAGALFTQAELDAMQLLGAAPGCNMRAAYRAGRRRGVPEKDLSEAVRLLAPLSPPLTFGSVVKEGLWKVLTLVPPLIAMTLYVILLRGNTLNFFPGHTDPALSAWYSGTLVASITVSILFTLIVPILLVLVIRRITAPKRKCRRFGVVPSSYGVGHSISALIDLMLLLFFLFFSLSGAVPFYQNTYSYLMDFDQMRQNAFVSVDYLEPRPVYNWNYNSHYGTLINVGGGLVLDGKLSLYLGNNGDFAYDGSGIAHEISVRCLPHTGLMSGGRVLSYEIYDDIFYDGDPILRNDYHMKKSLALFPDGVIKVMEGTRYYNDDLDQGETLSQLNLKELFGLERLTLQDHIYILMDQKANTAKIVCSGYSREDEDLLFTLLIDMEDGTILESGLLDGWKSPEAFLLDSGDLVILAFRELPESQSDGVSKEVSAFLLNGKTVKLQKKTALPVEISDFRQCEIGRVNSAGIDVTLQYYSGTGEIFVPLDAAVEP